MSRIPTVATSPYSECRFRLLGLTAEATPEEVRARAETLLGRDLGAVTRPEQDLGWLPEIRQEPPPVREAVEALERLDVRMRERLFWFHQRSEVDRRALEALWDGRPEEAEDLWRQAWRDEQLDRATAAHNLAVLYHSRALSAPRGELVALEDFERARRWWSHVLEGGRATVLMLDGEAEDLQGAPVVSHALRIATAQLHDLLTRGLTARPELVRDEHIPLLDGWEVGEDFASERFQTRQGLMLAALEEAEEAVRRGDRPTYEECIERARDCCMTPADQNQVDARSMALARRLVMRGLKPVRTEPVVVNVSGLGTTMIGMDNIDPATRSYESLLMFTLAHLPVLPLGRFRVAEREDGTYEFFGRLPFDGWQLIHQLVLLGVVFVFFWGAANLSRLPNATVERIMQLSGSVASELKLTPEELEELRTSPAARREKLRELDRALADLRQERQRLRDVRIPDLEKRLAQDRKKQETGELQLGVLYRQKALDEAWARYGKIPEEIRRTEQLRRRIEELGER